MYNPTLQADNPRQTTPRPHRDSHWSGRYASYWNAFLLINDQADYFDWQVITFIDLAGHEKYLKTTVFGMTGHAPDFSMLMVSMQFNFVIFKKSNSFVGGHMKCAVEILVELWKYTIWSITLKRKQHSFQMGFHRIASVFTLSSDSERGKNRVRFRSV